MASSRSFSCSSWGDCCVVGWEEKWKPNQTEFNYLSEAVYNWTKPVFPHFRTHSKWHCSVSTRGLSEVVVWHVTEKAQGPGTNLREVTGALSTTAEHHCSLDSKAMGAEWGQLFLSNIQRPRIQCKYLGSKAPRECRDTTVLRGSTAVTSVHRAPKQCPDHTVQLHRRFLCSQVTSSQLLSEPHHSIQHRFQISKG